MLNYDNFHLYQKRVVASAIRVKSAYLFLDTGMGKTVLSMAIFDQLKKRRRVQSALITAPKYVMNNIWRQEAKRWEFSKDFTFSKIHGSTYKGSAEYSRRMAYMDNVDFHLINYEGIVWLSNHILKNGGKPKWDMIVYDESTRIKNTQTKRFKAFKKFMGQFKYRYCLTGTPTPNGLDDIFGQVIAVDNGVDIEANNITTFRKKYMRPLYTLHGRVTVYDERPGAREEVAKKLAPRTMRLKKTEHLKLPPIHYHNVELEMPEYLRNQYDTLEREFFYEYGGRIVETFSKVTTDMKLRQFLQGKVYDIEGKTLRIHTLKQMALREIKLDGNTLIAYNFKFEREEIWSVRPNSPFIDSRTKDKQAEKWIIGWNNYEFKNFLVNPMSAAFGLNLQAGGNNIIWYSLTWDSEHYSQLIDRLWRQGQTKPVNVYHIIFKDTIDTVVAKALQRKDSDQTKLMDDIVAYGRSL